MKAGYPLHYLALTEEKVVSRSDISCNEQGKQASCYFQGDI